MFNPIPFSVRMRNAGFVFDKHVRSMNIYDKWVPKGTTIADRKAAYASKVDHTVDILARFVAKWTIQSRQARNRPREVRWSGPNWGDIVYMAEQAETNRLVLMDEHTYSALRRSQIAEYKATGRDILPLIRSWSHVNELRDEFTRKTALAAIDHVRVIAAAKLHNTQRPAQVRVIRNRFAIDSDSE
jgi:hypothetical protein